MSRCQGCRSLRSTQVQKVVAVEIAAARIDAARIEVHPCAWVSDAVWVERRYRIISRGRGSCEVANIARRRPVRCVVCVVVAARSRPPAPTAPAASTTSTTPAQELAGRADEAGTGTVRTEDTADSVRAARDTGRLRLALVLL